MTASTNGIVYEAIQRRFRNEIVELVRRRLTEAYGTEARARVAKMFPSWDEIKAAAARSSSTGVVSHPHVDEFAFIDVSHFLAIFNNEFEVLAPVDGLPPEVTKDVQRQVLGFLREIKTVRDPVSHPTDADLDPYDALRAVDNALRVCRQLGLDSVVGELSGHRSELAELAAESSSASRDPISIAPEGLPPRDSVVTDFVGRRAELSALWQWVVDDGRRRWLLTGEGGKGKSAIAYQFATEVLQSADCPFAVVQWMSAKRRRFAEGETVSIGDPDFHDLPSAVDKLLSDLGWSEHLSKPFETKRLLLLQLVKDFDFFLVVDDVDSLEGEEEEAIEFLASELPNAGAKVLLTSRRGILGMGKSCSTVKGLTDEEASEFVDSRLSMFDLDPSRISSKQRRRIIKLCEGSPLYMEDLLRLCTFLPVSQALQSWQDNAGDKVRRYALERELEMLSADARSVLEAACVVGAAATALELQHVLGFSEDRVLNALVDLRRHHLVPAPELVEEVPRFSVNSNLRSLVLSTLDGTERKRKLETAVNAVTGGDLIGKSSRAIEDYRRQAEVLLRSGQCSKAEETIKNGLVAHPNEPRLLAALGNVYERWKPRTRSADARKAWLRAYELGSTDRRMYLTWTRAEEGCQEWQRMLAAAQRGLERVDEEDPALLQQAGYAASRLAQSLQASFNDAKSRQMFEESDDYLFRAVKAGKSNRIEPFFISRTYRALVINAQKQRHEKALCGRLKQWISWDPNDAVALEEAERQAAMCRKHKVDLGLV